MLKRGISSIPNTALLATLAKPTFIVISHLQRQIPTFNQKLGFLTKMIRTTSQVLGENWGDFCIKSLRKLLIFQFHIGVTDTSSRLKFTDIFLGYASPNFFGRNISTFSR